MYFIPSRWGYEDGPDNLRKTSKLWLSKTAGSRSPLYVFNVAGWRHKAEAKRQYNCCGFFTCRTLNSSQDVKSRYFDRRPPERWEETTTFPPLTDRCVCFVVSSVANAPLLWRPVDVCVLWRGQESNSTLRLHNYMALCLSRLSFIGQHTDTVYEYFCNLHHDEMIYNLNPYLNQALITNKHLSKVSVHSPHSIIKERTL